MRRCACCSPAPALSFAPAAASRCRLTALAMWSRRCKRCPPAPAARSRFPSRRDRSGRACWRRCCEEGYVRIQVGGTVYRIDDGTLPQAELDAKAWVLLDRVEIGKTPRERLAESVEAAFRRGHGRLGVLTDAGESVFDQRFFCSPCNRLFPTPEPSLFDANDPPAAVRPAKGRGRRESPMTFARRARVSAGMPMRLPCVLAA